MQENEAFQKFHGALKLDPKEVAFAQAFPEEVRDALTEQGVVLDFSFLQGSLARGTMICPMKDIDMVGSLSHKEHGELLTDPLGPTKAMALLQDALTKGLGSKYTGLSFSPPSRHAVQLELGSNLPSFDFVPAFEETPNAPN